LITEAGNIFGFFPPVHATIEASASAGFFLIQLARACVVYENPCDIHRHQLHRYFASYIISASVIVFQAFGTRPCLSRIGRNAALQLCHIDPTQLLDCASLLAAFVNNWGIILFAA
jgi:hypothetical protein